METFLGLVLLCNYIPTLNSFPSIRLCIVSYKQYWSLGHHKMSQKCWNLFVSASHLQFSIHFILSHLVWMDNSWFWHISNRKMSIHNTLLGSLTWQYQRKANHCPAQTFFFDSTKVIRIKDSKYFERKLGSLPNFFINLDSYKWI